jgi:hydroxylamine reductase (hybrid-cluster protein)
MFQYLDTYSEQPHSENYGNELVMVPQCHRGERGLMESESRSHWVGNMFRHTMTSQNLGARAFARLIARNHHDEFDKMTCRWAW